MSAQSLSRLNTIESFGRVILMARSDVPRRLDVMAELKVLAGARPALACRRQARHCLPDVADRAAARPWIALALVHGLGLAPSAASFLHQRCR